MRPSNVVIFSAKDASVNQAYVPISAQFFTQCSVQGVVTGSSTGTIKVQVSNDPSVDSSKVVNWSDLPSATATLSAAGTFLVPKTDLCFNWIQVIYTKNNGSAGTITANLHAWGI